MHAASTCALTIGLNLNWSSDRFADDQLNAANVALYLVAVPWAQWSGTAVRLYGAYAVIVFGAVASVCAGVVSAAFPCSVFGLYAARTLHGSATASLAVAVPNYMADAGKGLYQSEYSVVIANEIPSKFVVRVNDAPRWSERPVPVE